MADNHTLLSFDNMEQMVAVFGSMDGNMEVLSKAFDVGIRSVPSGLEIRGEADNVRLASQAIDVLKQWQRRGEKLNPDAAMRAVDLVRDGKAEAAEEMVSDVIAITSSGKPVKARSFGQKQYVDAIRKNTLVFCVGPAGTGKTYLAMAMAVIALKNKQVSRIILTRPAVEAGESLGFLPGDLQNKVDPYLRPLYDALYDFMGADAYKNLSEKGVIEVAPLAYMRGRTLNDAFIILDEAQNCTNEQMKMFLTRFGEGSKVVVTGDITQIDLPKEKTSGLKRAIDILDGIKQISIRRLTHKDVVRHPLVKSIIRAYDDFEARRKSAVRPK